MKPNSEIYRSKILSGNSKMRSETIKEIAASGGEKQLEFLMNILSGNNIGNTVAIAIKAIGDAGNVAGKNILIETYGAASDREKQLILESLWKLEVFKELLPVTPSILSIQEVLWALCFGMSSIQLKLLLALGPEKFKKRVDSALHTARRWRRQNK